MLYYTSFQIPEFIALLCTGMLMAAISLLFSLFRRLICAGRWLTLLCDLMLGLIWAIVFCTAITLAAYGNVHIYHIIALAAGAALFHFALTLPLRRACARACRRVSAICRQICQSPICRILFK